MKQQKKHPNEVVRALMNNAKTIFKDTFGGYPENHPDAVAAIAQLLQNEGMLSVHKASFELQQQGTDLAIQNTESSLKMNATTTALAEAQIQWLNEQRTMHEMENAEVTAEASAATVKLANVQIDMLTTSISVDPDALAKGIGDKIGYVVGEDLTEPYTVIPDPSESNTIVVVVNGFQYDVDKWIKWTAIDRDGNAWGFENEPEISSTGGWLPCGGRFTLITRFDGVPLDWTETLTEVSQ